ncbi:hypothetical protein M2650_10050 [Luteimonas sp. SX5]|uniref:RNA polymerase sigma factor 70 region 4 type 2 domain-containing protein n=1 Tax=Luteimonas galliterrae TaxID=2940486 RepID=A0ABT0MJD0_9GAMM|nr:hypothetical protein [Luteimonas galliterrae]MCL1634970.1 hypothetical protein [Luteimonas galliterrae]
MTARSLSDASGAPAAINAFLRGVERRGAVFAELQCGDAMAGDAALAATMRAFHAGAARAPFGEWPQRFWSLLLATPMLRRAAALPARADALAPLAQVGHGPRAALLLRLAAGLGETEAAAALGIAPATYRLALQRALPHRADGTPHAEAWRGMAAAVQEAIRNLPPQRLAHLAKLREAALQPVPVRRTVMPAVAATVTAVRARPRWVSHLLWLGVAACAAALAVSFLWPQPPRQETAGGAPDIRTVSLPNVEAPAARFDADMALLSDRDFELLLERQDEAVYRELDFYAWYATQTGAEATQAAAPGASSVAPPPHNVSEEPETSDDTL